MQRQITRRPCLSESPRWKQTTTVDEVADVQRYSLRNPFTSVRPFSFLSASCVCCFVCFSQLAFSCKVVSPRTREMRAPAVSFPCCCGRDPFLSPASQQHPPLLDCDDGTCTATLLFLRSDCNNKKRHSSSHGRLDRRTGTDLGWRGWEGWEGRRRDQRDATTVSDVTPAVARIISIASQSPVPLSTGGSRKSTRKLRCASPFLQSFHHMWAY